MGSFKIESKFYVIMGDDNPVYVGYTNRTVKQRFKEHLKDKDFSNYSAVRVVELNQYEEDFNFTWDYLIIQKDAEIVDNTERYLISKYGTQNSIYQKALGGGQNWSEIKHFVLANKNSPKFVGMSNNEVKKYLRTEHEVCLSLETFVEGMEIKEVISLKNFVKHLNLKEFVSLVGFIGGMEFKEIISLETFVGGIKLREITSLEDFIKGMNLKEVVSIKSFVEHMNFKEFRSLDGFVNSMETKEITSIKSFVSNMKFPQEISLMNFVYDMKEKNKND